MTEPENAAIRAFSRLPRCTLPSIVRDSDCETMGLDRAVCEQLADMLLAVPER